MATRSKAPPSRPAAAQVAQEPIREPIREQTQPMPEMPLVPGRVVATNRAGKPIQRVAAETGVDKFFIPPGVKPPGWSWEWKAETVLGESDPMYLSQLAQVGWEPVSYEQYPGVFAPRFDDQGNERKGPVRRGGQMLMERAQILTDEAMADDKRKADEKVGSSRRQYSAPLQELAARTQTAAYDITAQQSSYIRTSVENVTPRPMPGDNRQKVD